MFMFCSASYQVRSSYLVNDRAKGSSLLLKINIVTRDGLVYTRAWITSKRIERMKIKLSGFNNQPTRLMTNATNKKDTFDCGFLRWNKILAKKG